MNVYSETTRGPLRLPGFIDANDVTTISFFWGAPVWAADTVYREGDICRPTVDNGYYYQCITPGRTSATEPASWSQTEQVSGTAVFEAHNYDLFVLPGETLQSSGDVLASVWTVSGGATLSGAANNDMVTSVDVSVIPAGVKTLTLTNRVRKIDGEMRERSIVLVVNEQ